MQLLVSVASVDEAAAALAGGAHVIDAKEPARGALGAVDPATLEAICRRVGPARPVSAALGDALDERAVARDAYRCAAAGVAFVKVGFAGSTDERRVVQLLEAARAGCAVVAVGYADAAGAHGIDPFALIDAAGRAGASGVLLDTADKRGPGLRTLLSAAALDTWVRTAHGAGLQVALAGRLTKDDLPFIRETGADIAGVRGAACDGGRTGHVVSAKVRALVDLVGGDGDRLDAGRQGTAKVAVDEIAC